MQQQKLLQEAASSAEARTCDAQQHQQHVTEENAILKHEIQVTIYRISGSLIMC